jgi:hypothetical protein
LIGALMTRVVSPLLESCGMMWNQPTLTTLSPACCAMAPAEAQAAMNAKVSLFIESPLYFLWRAAQSGTPRSLV